jgi:hypothetical protein
MLKRELVLPDFFPGRIQDEMGWGHQDAVIRMLAKEMTSPGFY